MSVRRGERCGAPVLDEQKRAKLCGKPAVAERHVSTGYRDERVDVTFCALHAAEHDAKQAPGGAP